MLTDPIADMLTRLRNQSAVNHSTVTLPYSKIKKAILNILVEHKFIQAVETKNEGQKPELEISLLPNKKLNIRRISKPGQRIYVKKDDIRKVMNGLGISILSTPAGVITNREARAKGIGGELICEIY